LGSYFQSLEIFNQIFLCSALFSALALSGWILWWVFVDGFSHKGQNANQAGANPSDKRMTGYRAFQGVLGFLMIFGVTSLALTRFVPAGSSWSLVGAVLAGGRDGVDAAAVKKERRMSESCPATIFFYRCGMLSYQFPGV